MGNGLPDSVLLDCFCSGGFRRGFAEAGYGRGLKFLRVYRVAGLNGAAITLQDISRSVEGLKGLLCSSFGDGVASAPVYWLLTLLAHWISLSSKKARVI